MNAIDSLGTHLTLLHSSEETALRNPAPNEYLKVTTNTADVMNTE